MVARRRLREKRARRVRVVTVRWGSRKGGAKFGETFEGGEPGAALVPVAGGEGHLRGLRGGEIRQLFFRRQFEGMTLDQQDRLSAPVDGITGATLSVDAVSRLARLALVLHKHVTGKQGD